MQQDWGRDCDIEGHDRILIEWVEDNKNTWRGNITELRWVGWSLPRSETCTQFQLLNNNFGVYLGECALIGGWI
jgi:hypothetical protein